MFIDIRDPIHGSIALSPAEHALTDSPYLQRLRAIKQLGFSELTFPGASHSRFLHSLGAMQLAGQAFDAVFRQSPWLPDRERERLRQTIRLATLCHDLGHPPLSHSSEVLLPRVGALRLPGVRVADPTAQASHEHMTLKILLDSGLTDLIAEVGADLGIEARHVAALLSDDVACDPAVFEVGGRNVHGLLATLASSELDVDRMDYLLRDSYFTGVSYGQFDCDWLIRHLSHDDAQGGPLHLTLDDRAIFTFDDFLLSRHHMFLMVYFHKKSVCYDHMLQRFYEQFPDLCRAPADPEAYLELDDHRVWQALRSKEAESPWAAGIMRRKPLSVLIEATPTDRPEPIAALLARLDAEQIAYLHVSSQGALSKYQPDDVARAIYVRKQPAVGEPYLLPLAEATRLYDRYADATVLERLYVPTDSAELAAGWLVELRKKL